MTPGEMADRLELRASRSGPRDFRNVAAAKLREAVELLQAWRESRFIGPSEHALVVAWLEGGTP